MDLSDFHVILASLHKLFNGLVVVTRLQRLVIDLHLNRILRPGSRLGLPNIRSDRPSITSRRWLSHGFAGLIRILLDLTVLEVLLFLAIARTSRLIKAIFVAG